MEFILIKKKYILLRKKGKRTNLCILLLTFGFGNIKIHALFLQKAGITMSNSRSERDENSVRVFLVCPICKRLMGNSDSTDEEQVTRDHLSLRHPWALSLERFLNGISQEEEASTVICQVCDLVMDSAPQYLKAHMNRFHPYVRYVEELLKDEPPDQCQSKVPSVREAPELVETVRRATRQQNLEISSAEAVVDSDRVPLYKRRSVFYKQHEVQRNPSPVLDYGPSAHQVSSQAVVDYEHVPLYERRSTFDRELEVQRNPSPVLDNAPSAHQEIVNRIMFESNSLSEALREITEELLRRMTF